MVRRPFLVTAFLSFRHLIRVLSPELQECMDQTKGALLRAHTAEEAAKPPKFWAQSRGRTSATIRCEQSTKGGGAIAEFRARIMEAVVGAP